MTLSTAQDTQDLLSGRLTHVATIAHERTGKRPSPATTWRWCRKGVAHGTIRLQAIYACGYWSTTPAAFDKFLRDQTAAAHAGTTPADADDDALRAAGLL